jgi:hypothetical protein
MRAVCSTSMVFATRRDRNNSSTHVARGWVVGGQRAKTGQRGIDAEQSSDSFSAREEMSLSPDHALLSCVLWSFSTITAAGICMEKKNGGNGSTSFPSARDVFLPNITGLARASCTAFHASGRRGVLICQEAGMGWYGWDVSPRVSRQSQENTSWPRCNPHTFRYCLQSLQSALGNRAPPQARNETYYLN